MLEGRYTSLCCVVIDAGIISQVVSLEVTAHIEQPRCDQNKRESKMSNRINLTLRLSTYRVTILSLCLS